MELANLQDQEVGDGTTSVVILAAELLKHANEIIKQGVHPTTVISGYNLAKKEASCSALGWLSAVLLAGVQIHRRSDGSQSPLLSYHACRCSQSLSVSRRLTRWAKTSS